MKNLYIAVENKNRELYAKVLLACVAAEKGFVAIVGMNTEIKKMSAHWMPGIVLWKGLARKGGMTFRRFHDMGHKVVSWCEEGLVYPSADFYSRYRVFPEALKEVDVFFAWGQNQVNDILSKVPDGKKKIIIAGNPRLDLLTRKYRSVFDAEAKEIREKYSPFILINTNFSAYTHKLGADNVIESLQKAGRIQTEDDRIFYQGRAENRKKVLHGFLEMTAKLADTNPGINIILRPHSAESDEYWRALHKRCPNVHVVHRGSVIPWIMASELLIHNDCTTGLEAYLLGKPVISYRPTAGNPYESRLPVLASKSIEDSESLVGYVEKLLHGQAHFGSEIDTESLAHYIASIHGKNSVDVVVDKLDELATSIKSNLMQDIKQGVKAVYGYLKMRILFTGGNQAIGEKPVNTIPKKDKFSGLEVAEVEELVQRLSENNARFNNLSVTAIPGTQTCIRIDARTGVSVG